MTAPIVSPYVPFYASLQPYITIAEFLSAPTGVDTTQLVPNGTPADNGAALATVIASASNYADSLCYQVLAATTDVQVGEYRIWRDGTIRVPVDFSPLIELTGVAIGYRAGTLTALTDLSGCWLEKKVARIPVTSLLIPGAAIGASNGVQAGRGSVFAQVTYVNGYANTALAASTAAAASSFAVKSPLGIFAGMPLTIYDGKSTESVTVAPTYVQGSTTVPVVSPLLFAHDITTGDVAVSALPRAVKQAVIALTAHLIKSRGAEALALSGLSGGPREVVPVEPGTSEEYEQAIDLLHPFKRVI